ncbi:hypothetical protein [Microtetraspora fusca]|uniref:Uncharacterized protein n=1 Tax=Microtetraspora fusca TaxID=1997 RepID=A0ABW6VKR3_MICFU|nr:hypothetical protein [Microtetraspora fusca]
MSEGDGHVLPYPVPGETTLEPSAGWTRPRLIGNWFTAERMAELCPLDGLIAGGLREVPVRW